VKDNFDWVLYCESSKKEGGGSRLCVGSGLQSNLIGSEANWKFTLI
jgi:hypothetical protein